MKCRLKYFHYFGNNITSVNVMEDGMEDGMF